MNYKLVEHVTTGRCRYILGYPCSLRIYDTYLFLGLFVCHLLMINIVLVGGLSSGATAGREREWHRLWRFEQEARTPPLLLWGEASYIYTAAHCLGPSFELDEAGDLKAKNFSIGHF